MRIVTLLGTETFTAQSGERVDEVNCDGFGCNFSARTLGNTGGQKRDRSKTGIYAASDSAALGGQGVVFGPFDIIYCATGSDPIRLIVRDLNG